MKDLINHITQQTGLPETHVSAVIENVAIYVKQKYPLLATTVDTVLANGPASAERAIKASQLP